MAACFRAGEDDQALALFNLMRSSTPLALGTRDSRTMVSVTLGIPSAVAEEGRVLVLSLIHI